MELHHFSQIIGLSTYGPVSHHTAALMTVPSFAMAVIVMVHVKKRIMQVVLLVIKVTHGILGETRIIEMTCK